MNVVESVVNREGLGLVSSGKKTQFFSYLFSHTAPVMVIDCTMNANCAANTDGNTICVNNVCTGKSTAQGKIRIS